MKKYIITYFLVTLLGGMVIYHSIPTPPVTKIYNQVPSKKVQAIIESKTLPAYVLVNSVPFTTQAPFAEWEDIRQQEGCEEASLLMAAYWTKGLSLNAKLAKEEILSMVEFQKENFGFFIHTDVVNTQEILNTFYKVNNTEISYNVTLNDIKQHLFEGSVVITPLNGKSIQNPYFLNGGPEHHMVLVIGYDDNKQELIVHDPGTRRGKAYRYDYQIFESSMDNYPSSTQEIQEGRPHNAILVVRKQ